MKYESLVRENSIHICSSCHRCHKCHKCYGRDGCHKHSKSQVHNLTVDNLYVKGKIHGGIKSRDNTYCYIYKNVDVPQIVGPGDNITFNTNGPMSCNIIHSVFANQHLIRIVECGTYHITFTITLQSTTDISSPNIPVTVGLLVNDQIVNSMVYSSTLPSIYTPFQLYGEGIVDIDKDYSELTLQNLGLETFIIPDSTLDKIVVASICITKL